ncbi:hypothetical protein GOBAR_DD06961 [Gossypium barbadense]|nr:hypothetical protein GOBAR_DD06961 [Gossypium barbadense]
MVEDEGWSWWRSKVDHGGGGGKESKKRIKANRKREKKYGKGRDLGRASGVTAMKGNASEMGEKKVGQP